MSSLDESYEFYKQNPTQDALADVVKKLDPTISYALSNYNAQKDPVIKSKAKVVAGKAVQNYDPQFGANLNTHVANQLKQLNRTVRKQRSPVNIGERSQLDSYALHKAEQEFIDKHGKEPDLHELADASGISERRIHTLKSQNFAIGTDTSEIAEDFGGGAETPDYTMDAISYVYDDSDYKDRKILEYKLGYGGRQQLSSKEIAEKLNLNPSQISRRSAKLIMKVNEIMEALEN